MNKKEKKVTIRIPQQVEIALERLKDKTGSTHNSIIKMAILLLDEKLCSSK